MELIIIVGGFLVPVILVFGYSFWRSRKRKQALAATRGPQNEDS